MPSFSEPRRRVRHLPRCMQYPPVLNETAPVRRPTRGLSLLIHPFYPKDAHGSFGKHVLTPSLSLTSVAAATPAGWDVHFWDENLLQGPPPCNPLPQVVGIMVHLTFAERAYALADWYRRQGSIVVLGGLHVTSCPDEVARHAHAIVVGNGVHAWPQLLTDVADGRLKSRYEGSYLPPYQDEPGARRALLPRDPYLTTASLIATRGCVNRCRFCWLATSHLQMPRQVRHPQDVVREFLATGEPYGVFIDNNLGANRAYLRELCAALRPVERIWSAAVTIDLTDDPSLIRDMALAGCTGVFVGLESMNGPNLADANKRTPPPEDYARRVAIFHEYGIQVNASFVFGFDHDRPDVFDRTLAWAETNRIECATYHILTPYPGTPLFEQLEGEGRLLHRDWRLYDTAHAVFRPRLMSPEQLEAGYDACYQRTFSLSSIWKRRPSLPAQVPGYLAMSVLYKKCNWLWPWLIRHRLTHRVWRPLVELARVQQVRHRQRLAAELGGLVPVEAHAASAHA